MILDITANAPNRSGRGRRTAVTSKFYTRRDNLLDIPAELTASALHGIFRSGRKATATQPAAPAGPGGRLKGEYALALADHIARASEAGESVWIPDHFKDLIAFVAGDPDSETPQTDRREESEPAS